MSRGARLAAWSLVAGVALLPALLLQGAEYDFLFYRDRARMKRLAWIALAIPLLSLVPAVLLGWHREAARVAERVARAWLGLRPRTRWLGALGVFAAGIAVSSGVLLHFPNSADEYAYLFQAETYALGRVWMDPDPLDASLHFMHGKVIDGKWVSRFPPGWPLFLAPFLALGLPAWLVNPLVAAACAVLLYGFGRRQFGERAALLGAALFVGSAFLLLNAGSYFSHPFAALLSIAFAAAAARFLEKPSLTWALLAGLALGWLGLARHMNAALLFVPFFLALLARRSPSHLWKAWPLAASAGGFLLLLFAYNAVITGDPLVLPTTINDPKQALGFVQGHTPERAYKFIQHRILLLPRYTSGLFVFLYVLALARGAARRDLRWWDSYFLLEVLGYALYRNDSHDTFGPRYLFEAFPFAALRIAAACAPREEGRPWPPFFTWLVGVHLASAAVAIVATAMLHAAVVRERRDPIRLVEEKELRDAVVFVLSDTSPTRRMRRFDLVRNGVHVDRQAVIWAHYQERQLDALRTRFPERSFWVYLREPEAVQGRLLSLAEWRARPAPDV